MLRRCCAYFVAPVGLCILMGIVLAWYHVPENDQYSFSSHHLAVPVPRRKMETSMKYKDLAEDRIPVILTGTVADRWPAKTAFSTQFLNRKLKSVAVHRQEQNRAFITFHDDKPLEPLVTARWEDFNLKVNATISDILQWDNPVSSAHEGPFMYYSQDVATLRNKFPDILGFLQPIKPFIISNDNVQVNLWVGRAGLVTHAHYDCTYNFFVQLQGKKRFTLFPPDQSLYLYPCLHPHYGHSQVDILHPDMDMFPKFTRTGSYVAEVTPGDVLIVPPFWFHHVETLKESVSVNVWSDAPEYALLNDIYSRPIPFEEDWSHRDLVVATRVYIEMICVSVHGGPAHFINTLVEQRYFPLAKANTLMVNETLSDQMLQLWEETDWDKEMHRFENIFQSRVEDLTDLLGAIPLKSTMAVCLCNYIEHLLYSVVGLDYVFPYLLAWNTTL